MSPSHEHDASRPAEPLRAHRRTSRATTGRVYLIGAGPGAPDLITVRGRERLQAADVVLYDRLIPFELLSLCRDDAERIDVSKRPGRVAKAQADTNTLLVEHARAGRTVVRLKGGDPFVFGRGGEELEVCRAAGISCEIVPGVTSAIAAPATVGVPITHRHIARSFAVITGKTDQTAGLPPHDWHALAKIDTLCLMMARSNLAEIAAALIAAGKPADTPAVAVASATMAQQRSATGTLATIADVAEAAQLEAPVLTVVGPTAAMAVEHLPALIARTRPLEDKRIIITQARTSTSPLRTGLMDAGARLVEIPLIDVVYPPASAIDEQLHDLAGIDWLVLTSVHGVRGFWRRLAHHGLDARALGGVRIAAVGPGTAAELRERGINADLIPDEHSGAGLVAALRGATDLHGARVLYPHGSGAFPTVGDGLRAAGATVHAGVVYETRPITPSPAALEQLKHGAAALVFSSPAAVLQYAALNIQDHATPIACIGPTTAQAAQDAGLQVTIIPEQPGSRGLVKALEAHFAAPRTEVASTDRTVAVATE
jgi:uroporphyrinogen III methyltransferase/synthase